LTILVDKMRVAQEQLSQRRFYFRYFRADAKSRKWGMSVTTCGKSIILPEDGSYPPRQHPPHYHFDWEHGRALNEYQIVYIPEGYGLFETKNQKIKIRGDNVILLRPGLWHRYRPKPETGWREYWVCGSRIQKDLRRSRLSRQERLSRARIGRDARNL
jgi:hypothetical protein